jgi:hypothetical protein
MYNKYSEGRQGKSEDRPKIICPRESVKKQHSFQPVNPARIEFPKCKPLLRLEIARSLWTRKEISPADGLGHVASV